MALIKSSFAQSFDTTFRFLKGKRIVLYGIGYRTGEIIEQLDYTVIGLLDRDQVNIGKEYFGKIVLSNESRKNFKKL